MTAEASVHVRDARPDDAAFLVAANVAMAAETEHVDLDPDTVRAGVGAVFDDPTKGAYLVAERRSDGADGELVGGLLTVPEWSDWRNGTVLWIHSVWVRPDARGQGVYAAMYAHLQDRVVADDNDLRGLRLYVDRRNDRARAVYERLGMDGSHYDLFEWLP